MNKKLVALVVGFLCISTLSVSVSKAKASSLPPVAYWRFDEGSGTAAYDSSGNGNTGTLMNSPQWVSANGVNGTWLSFDGVAAYVLVPDSSSLHLSSAVTVETWVYLPKGATYGQVPGAVGRTILSKDSPNGGTGLNLGICNDLGAVQFGVGNDGVYSPLMGTDTPTGYVPRDEWTFVAATYDGSLMRVYINGTLMASASWTGGINTDNGMPLTIGKKNYYTTGFDYQINGSIYLVRIYDYARSSEEVMEDMFNPSPNPTPSPFWMQWFFWTNVPLAIAAVGFASMTFYYRKKAFSPREGKSVANKPLSREAKTCPNCGATLPPDSKFCGKCGTSLE